jgi:hypothetical protein
MTWGPRTQISPDWPMGSMLPSSSAMPISVEEIGSPIESLKS